MASLFQRRDQQKAEPKREPKQTQVLPETIWADESMPSGIPPQGSVVVTISRQFGSGGAEIGRIVARNCGLQYIDREIIDAVAARLGVNAQQVARQDEQAAGSVGRILDAMQSSSLFAMHYHTLLGSPLAPAQSGEQAYLHLTQKVILELATAGNVVIVGRGAQFLLRGSPRTLHIYVFASLPRRIENLMEHFQLDQLAAAELIERRDYEYDTYAHHCYGSDRHQPNLYHLLINTDLFPLELAASLIQQALPVGKEIGQVFS